MSVSKFPTVAEAIDKKRLEALTERKRKHDAKKALEAQMKKIKERQSKRKKKKTKEKEAEDSTKSKKEAEINRLQAIIANPKSKLSAKLKARRRLAELMK